MAYQKKGGYAMRQINELKTKLGEHFKWHGARIKFLALFISSLFIGKTVNFTEIANKMAGNANQDSRYKKIQRFFRFHDIDDADIARFVSNVIPHIGEKWILTLDRTNWQFGKQNINILTLGIVHDGIAFPLLWIMLDKKGNSDTHERIELIDRFIEIFGKDKIECLVADREFIGKEWINYLIDTLGIKFRIRVKSCEYINKKNGDSAPLKDFFRNIKIGQLKVLDQKREIWGIWLYITGTKSSTGELVIVITQDEPETALEDYKKRWEIETLFKCLKTSGFNLEDTHLKDHERIDKLMSVLTIAFSWTYITGEWKQSKTPIKLKTHGRKEKSVFRLGLDFLGEIFVRLNQKVKEFKIVIRFLSCT